MNKKAGRAAVVIFSVLLLLGTGVYIWLRFDVLKAKDYKPDARKAATALDLRPAIIAKLQQLVKDGSDSLYRLSIDTLRPDLLASTLDASGIIIDIDTPSYKRLEALQRLPDDVYKCSFATLHIDGIGIDALLHKRRINAGNIKISKPKIEAWHRAQPYNRADRQAQKGKTLYDRIHELAGHISIAGVHISSGSFVHHIAAKQRGAYHTMNYKDISLVLSNILIDSSTAYDASRILFAKTIDLSCGAFSTPTADSNYEFAVGGLKISGERHELIATGIVLKPRGGRAAAIKRQTLRSELFELSFPQVTLRGIDWSALMNGERVTAAEAIINEPACSIYLSKEKPTRRGITVDVFPQQLLANAGVPVSISVVKISGGLLSYEEYDPQIGKSSKVIFNAFSLNADNVTNIPEAIDRSFESHVSARCLLMNQSPISGSFIFDLRKQRHGAFQANITAGETDHSVVNPFAETMGLVRITTGAMHHVSVQASGNNSNIIGRVSVAYTDLHVKLLSKNTDENGRQHRKKLKSLLANFMLIKNNNPGADGRLRESDFSLPRGDHGNFFNYTWSAIKVGVLKNIGVPPKLVMKL